MRVSYEMEKPGTPMLMLLQIHLPVADFPKDSPQMLKE